MRHATFDPRRLVLLIRTVTSTNIIVVIPIMQRR
jgi:hypothetical protein